MADVRAFRSGNWSDTTATSPWWNGTAIFAPSPGDVVYSNTFIITIDTSVNLGASSTITNGAATSRTWKDGGTATATIGGGFPLTNGVTLTCNILGNAGGGSSACSTSGSISATIVGNVSVGGTNSALGVVHASSGTLTITGNVTAGSTGTAHGISNTSTGTINFTGLVTGATASTYGISNSSSGTVNITSSLVTSNGVLNSSTGVVSITGNVTASSTSNGAANTSTGTFTIIGDITATNGANGFTSASASATNRLSGSFINSANGTAAIYATKYVLWSTPLLAKTRYAKDGISQYVDMFTSDNNPNGGVATTNVRLGVSYGGGLVGTCAVPNPGTVAFGVAVDNTTGTAVLDPNSIASAVQSALTSQGFTTARAGNLDNLDTTVSSRLAPSGTLATVTNLTNAPASVTPADIWGYSSRTLTSASGPTAVQIRQEIDTNSTKLANLDATVSSRLAASAYTAPTTPPTAAQVRAEIDANSTQLAAIKTKTDALNTDRLSQTATTAIVGALIAQANS